ncbi:MAG: hypothetical protein ACOZBH_05255 [Patescibacteria group bacterium]
MWALEGIRDFDWGSTILTLILVILLAVVYVFVGSLLNRGDRKAAEKRAKRDEMSDAKS